MYSPDEKMAWKSQSNPIMPTKSGILHKAHLESWSCAMQTAITCDNCCKVYTN